MLKIVHIPHPVLTTPVKQVKSIDSKVKKLVKDMKETLEAQTDPQGVGLAATQVGIGLNLFISKPTAVSPVGVFINPKILETKGGNGNSLPKKKNADEDSLEGCLSIPKIWSPVKRAPEVYLQYQTVDGELKREWFKDFEAVIIQHEVDHLQGILFPQRAVEQGVPLYEEKHGELKKMKGV